MKRVLLFAFAFSILPLAARAADAPDCSAQKTAHEDAVKAAKVKPDLTPCKEMKGKEKTECEKPIKEKAKADATDAKAKVADAKKALDCCKNPKKKGCS